MVDKAGEKNFATRCCRIVFEHAMMECQECLRVTIQQAGTALLAQMAGAPRKSLQPQYSLSGNSWSRVELLLFIWKSYVRHVITCGAISEERKMFAHSSQGNHFLEKRKS